ncbi:MAG: 2-oxoglutarate dehydrogenase complex dihydrolipoyllysine-residue succinyltransferase [Pseudomonadota bacterium]
MVIEIRIPGVGESVREAVLAQWLKNDGDTVKRDEPILVIETDKVSLEVAAETDGVLHILVPAGTTVPIGMVVATLAVAEGAGTTALTPLPSSPLLHLAPGVQSSEPPMPAVSPTLEPPADARSSAPPVKAAFPHSLVHDSAHLPPSVRRLIHENRMKHPVDIAAVKGTGPGGRITKGDILLHLEAVPAIPAGSAAGAHLQAAMAALPHESSHETRHDAGDEPTTRKTLTPIRQRIAERLVQAKQQAAMLTTFNEIDMSRVMAVRTLFKDVFQKKHGVSLGFMSFFIKASIAALEDFPEINAFIDAKDIVYHHYYHIGIAVGSERGLVVPVLRHADRMGFADLEKAIASAVDKTASGKLGLSELEGGTFTISNGGVYGSLLSTPILNPPQSGILGMHKIEKRPVVIDDAIVIRPMMYVALSYDHRIVDGRGAVSFLKRIKECIEEPERLMMEI